MVGIEIPLHRLIESDFPNRYTTREDNRYVKILLITMRKKRAHKSRSIERSFFECLLYGAIKIGDIFLLEGGSLLYFFNKEKKKNRNQDNIRV